MFAFLSQVIERSVIVCGGHFTYIQILFFSDNQCSFSNKWIIFYCWSLSALPLGLSQAKRKYKGELVSYGVSQQSLYSIVCASFVFNRLMSMPCAQILWMQPMLAQLKLSNVSKIRVAVTQSPNDVIMGNLFEMKQQVQNYQQNYTRIFTLYYRFLCLVPTKVLYAQISMVI